MTKTIITHYMVCYDCWDTHNANIDALEYHYGDEHEEVITRCESGLSQITPKHGVLVTGDDQNSIEFTHHPCECCGSKLAGTRLELNAVEHS